MINDINLADIRSFVLITQLGNFTKAADALDVSRSHVSRQVSNLEKQIGATLLLRTTRTLKLTSAGQLFYLQCQQALEQIDQALIAVSDDIDAIQGEIRVNCVGGYLGEQLVASYASEFMKMNPDVVISLDFSSHRIDLISDDFDVAFRMGRIEDAGFIARKLINVDMGTYASPDYLAQHGQPKTPKQLNTHRCLVGSVKRWTFYNAENVEEEISLKGHLQCKNGRVLVQSAVDGNGIIRVPKLYCLSELKRDELVDVFEDWHIPSVDFSILYHQDRYRPKRLQAFIEYMIERFESNATHT
ncbi:LysR family transcriptional regulator [Vibrio sp. 10N.261.55.A7]|uniref:LysR family transcriptional regulator n=1 Tax=Vibrio sp. 10N.261.55.A7 TaxID=1880851 RepID=UPI000C83F5D8|nr:LysR family transcriptional regulator [Vibrio sp. 10N.261.55.A7]PMK02448.1 LysR family transcriptional regulator [Vibrio sp. 10N.261.55.A7]